jgi:hypothetical protein
MRKPGAHCWVAALPARPQLCRVEVQASDSFGSVTASPGVQYAANEDAVLNKQEGAPTTETVGS